LLLGIVVMLAGAQPASAACTGLSALFGGCKTTPTTAPPKPAPAPAPVPVAAPAPAPAPAAFDPAAAAQRLLDLTNQERAAAGIGPMAMRGDVTSIAQGHSEAMAAAGTIWHNEAYLTHPVRTALAAKMLGENVGMGGSVDQVHVALMNSPGHKANILEPVFTVVGMAVVKAPSGALYVTQDFVQPSGAAPKPLAPKAAVSKAAPKPPAAPRPKPAPRPAAPKPAAVPVAAPVTTVPETTTTTVAPDPEPTVLAAAPSLPPAPAPAPPAPSEPAAGIVVAAFALLSASATGAVRITRRASAPR
jgi:uncharacterized protein YkwD